MSFYCNLNELIVIDYKVYVRYSLFQTVFNFIKKRSDSMIRITKKYVKR